MTLLEAVQQQVRNARETVASLVSARAALEERAAELQTEREEVAFDAYTGDKAAKKRLDAINSEGIRHQTEAASIEAAMRTAQARLSEAEADQNRAQEAVDAQQALSLLDDLRAEATALDDAVATLLRKYEALKDTTRALRGLGALARPTAELIRVAARRALDAHLMFSDLRGEFLAPGERRTFTDLAAVWASGVEAWAAPRLEQTPELEAAD
jgi:chromosome segregation ATPase